MKIILVSMVILAIWFSTGAHAGMQEAQNAYAKKNYQAMLDNLKPLVNTGVPEAIFYIGLLYDNGEGVVQDYNKAKEWYLKAAKLGYAPAQTNLGWVLQMGTGTELSDKEAAEWYMKAANQGYAPAQYNLGLLYYAGRGGIPKDPRAAVAWFRKAAEQGYTPAQNGLAKMYQYGQGGLVSLIQAYKWFYLAAEAGNESAKENKQAIKKLMAPEMIEESQALAQEWLASRKKAASLN
ncbi:MAG: tetratricopeptide repeat protein [Gallionellaceae bacterium]